jgi:tetratricopeptide (TPR) repeat protein
MFMRFWLYKESDMKRLIPGVMILLSLAGCVSLTEGSAGESMQKGAAAENQGDWDAARRIYAQTFADKNLAQTSPRYRAVLHYEYGRSLGVTCFFTEAEHELTLAHNLDKKNSGVFYLSLTVLVRLNLAQQKFPEALSYFERALAELDPAITAKTTPVFYANVLDDYALALSGTGHPGRAKAATRQAAEVRANIIGEQRNGDTTPYGKQCGQS